MPLHSALNELPVPARHKRAVMLLSTACLGSSGAVLHLVEYNRLWEAELVMRSVVEGTVKFGHLLEHPDTFTARCIEFAEVLPAVALLRRHKRAGELLKALEDVPEVNTRTFRDLRLTDDEISQINAAYPHQTRRDIERRWGIHGSDRLGVTARGSVWTNRAYLTARLFHCE
jgi:hypothetical protein